MNKILAMMVLILSAMTSVAMTMVEARSKIDAVIAKPAEMTAVMRQLSAADQKAYVKVVNEAVSKLPGSTEEKCAVALNIARAAVRGAAKGGVSVIIAEIFATAPVESLVLINEVFAKDVLNRAADSKRVYTDAQFTRIAMSLQAKVNERLAGSEDAGVRGAFAAIMLIRASNGSPMTLSAELAGTLGEDAETAKTEWFPAALGKDGDYDPLIAATAAEKAPDVQVALMVAGPQRHELLLSALVAEDPELALKILDGFGDFSVVQTTDQGIYTLPRTVDTTKKWNPEYRRGQPYDGQSIGIE